MAKFDFTPEQLETAKQAKSSEELIEIAKEQGIEITAEQAKAFLDPPTGEISDVEIENVAGGRLPPPRPFPDPSAQYK